MGAQPPKRQVPAGRKGVRAIRPERYLQTLLAILLWCAVLWRVSTTYGQLEGIIAATCAAWGFVLVSSWATYLIDRAAAAGGPGGPRPPGGRWPGAPS